MIMIIKIRNRKVRNIESRDVKIKLEQGKE